MRIPRATALRASGISGFQPPRANFYRNRAVFQSQFSRSIAHRPRGSRVRQVASPPTKDRSSRSQCERAIAKTMANGRGMQGSTPSLAIFRFLFLQYMNRYANTDKAAWLSPR